MKIRDVLKLGAGGFALAAAATVAVVFHRANDRLRERIAELRRETVSVEKIEDQNERLQRLLTTARTDESKAAEIVQEEVRRLRVEVAERERKAELTRARMLAHDAIEAQAVASRDPRSGLARLENFRDVGRATPGAACETLVWAAMKGDERALSEALVLSEAARQRAESVLTTLPFAARERWTPEKIASLYMTAVIADVSAAHIVKEEFDSPERATVTLRIPGVEEAKSKLTFQLGENGWRAILTEHHIDVLRRKISAEGKK